MALVERGQETLDVTFPLCACLSHQDDWLGPLCQHHLAQVLPSAKIQMLKPGCLGPTLAMLFSSCVLGGK